MKTALSLLILLVIFVSCQRWYKAGNLEELGYPIETKLDFSIIRQYMDTLIRSYGYKVPEKWLSHDKLVSLDSVNNKRIYFKNEPEEMYLVSFNGVLLLSDVYNPKLNPSDWVANTVQMPKSEELRVKKRFQKEILNVIEKMAHLDHLPDSIIYFNIDKAFKN